ncbi:hypothetical protein N9Z70_02430 [Mariniblastus sp.]|nr:hypothetical protein [Mariniblastus sp.]
MRRRKKNRTQLSVSLFPFLAVLICTLGVLIVMLVMAVKSADVQSAKKQAEDNSEKLAQIAELNDAVSLDQIRINGMSAVRPDALEKLQQSRSHRSYLEAEVRKTNRELEQVVKQWNSLQSEAEPVFSAEKFSESDGNQVLAELEKAILQVRAGIDAKRQSNAVIKPTTYVIEPYKGSGGTFRRPIFIECFKDEIVLQPSGIRLRKDEFVLPLQPGNMLDSALLANREYWQRYDLVGKEGSPYPLVIVRPDGAETFVLVRRAMQSWDDEFGYELVDGSKALSFGKKDPQLIEEVELAIEEARGRQQSRIAVIESQRARDAMFSSERSRPGLRVSGGQGGFVSTARGLGDRLDESDARGSVSQSSSGSSTDFVSSINSKRGDLETQRTNSKSESNSSTGFSGARSKASAGGAGGAGGEVAGQSGQSELSVANQRGSNWALPAKTLGATGYVRPIRLFCGADYLELKSGGVLGGRISTARGTAGAIDPLVEQIWGQIKSWGVAGKNGYWKPQLRVTVLPGGERRFSELNGLLYNSGLLIEESRQ